MGRIVAMHAGHMKKLSWSASKGPDRMSGLRQHVPLFGDR